MLTKIWEEKKGVRVGTDEGSAGGQFKEIIKRIKHSRGEKPISLRIHEGKQWKSNKLGVNNTLWNILFVFSSSGDFPTAYLLFLIISSHSGVWPSVYWKASGDARCQSTQSLYSSWLLLACYRAVILEGWRRSRLLFCSLHSHCQEPDQTPVCFHWTRKINSKIYKSDGFCVVLHQMMEKITTNNKSGQNICSTGSL